MSKERYIKSKYIHYEDCDEVDLLCPVCESPPDYCLDHNHYRCPDCHEPLELDCSPYDQDQSEEYWQCYSCCKAEEGEKDPEREKLDRDALEYQALLSLDLHGEELEKALKELGRK